MQNFVKRGDMFSGTAPSGGVASGVGILIGTHAFSVSTTTQLVGAEFEGIREGVVNLAKTSALAIAVGDALYWDSTNKVCNKTATAQKAIGYADSVAANPSATVWVKLTPNAVPNL